MKKFGRWKVLKVEFRLQNDHRQTCCECICACGTKRWIELTKLTHGRTESCGCLRDERRNEKLTKHGLSRAPEYKIWHAMIARCSNPRSKSWKDYGGRGIKVCSRWRKSFLAFYKDMGARPNPKLTLDRWDNNGNYQPSNCQWETRKYQAKNRRCSVPA